MSQVVGSTTGVLRGEGIVGQGARGGGRALFVSRALSLGLAGERVCGIERVTTFPLRGREVQTKGEW